MCFKAPNFAPVKWGHISLVGLVSLGRASESREANQHPDLRTAEGCRPFPSPPAQGSACTSWSNQELIFMVATLPSRTLWSAQAEGGMFLPACHIKIPRASFPSSFLCTLLGNSKCVNSFPQQVRLHECLIAKKKKKKKKTTRYLEKIRSKDTQIDTGHIYEIRKWFSNVQGDE